MIGSLFSILGGLLLAFFQFIIGLFFALGSVYVGVKLFDKFTKGINEWQEIKKGNIAVGILLAAVVVSIGTVIQPGVMSIASGFDFTMPIDTILLAMLIGSINLLISLVSAVIAVYLAIKVLSKLTSEIDEEKELKKNNIAVAIFMAGVLITISFVISSAVAGITQVLNVASLSSLL